MSYKVCKLVILASKLRENGRSRSVELFFGYEMVEMTYFWAKIIDIVFNGPLDPEIGVKIEAGRDKITILIKNSPFL